MLAWGNAVLSVNPHLLIFVEGIQQYPDPSKPGGVDASWRGRMLTVAAFGQSRTPPHIAYVYPAGGKQGTTISVSIGGQALSDAKAIYFSGALLEQVLLPVESAIMIEVVNVELEATVANPGCQLVEILVSSFGNQLRRCLDPVVVVDIH